MFSQIYWHLLAVNDLHHLLLSTNSSYIAIHQLTSYIPINPFFERCQLLLIFFKEFIRGVKHTKIVVNTIFLNISIIGIPLYLWILKVICSSTISTKTRFAFREFFLESFQILSIKNETLNIIPMIFI